MCIRDSPYGPIYLDGFLDMAEGLNKFESERDFVYGHVRRYLDYVHGGGVRGNPNSGSFVVTDRDKAYSNPWDAAYYNGDHNDAHVWYRLAKEFESPEFLWASEQASLGGPPPAATSQILFYIGFCTPPNCGVSTCRPYML